MQTHLLTPAPNLVGLGLALQPVAEAAPEGPPQRPGPRTLAALVPAAALIVMGPALLPGEAALLGLALAFTTLDLAAYYYMLLALLPLVLRERPRALLALFGVELATHAVMVFTEDEAPAFVVRSVLVGWLLVGLAVAPLLDGLRRWRLAGQAIGEG